MTTTVDTLDDLRALVGSELGTSQWIEVDQARIDTFATATNDHQWIHTDPERARTGPFGTTIAHGYLTLALMIPLWSDLLEVRSVTTKVNYGLDKVRFPAPVPVGSKVRAKARLATFDDVPGGAQITVDVVIERDGSTKPVCIAKPIFRFFE
jgi:acyl dehydratase